MSGLTQGGRPELVLKLRAAAGGDGGKSGDGRLALVSPTVGIWRGGPSVGNFVSPDSTVGILEVLGKPHVLRAPDEARGQVVATAAGIATQTAVEFGEELLLLDPSMATGPLSAAAPGSIGAEPSEGVVLTSPSSGRFYARPAVRRSWKVFGRCCRLPNNSVTDPRSRMATSATAARTTISLLG